MDQIKRKGSKSIKEIPKDILELLNFGKIESANLVEWLAIDQLLLLKNLLEYLKPLLDRIEKQKKPTVNSLNEAIGEGILDLSRLNNDTEFLKILSTHISDSVRCWAAYTIGKNAELTILEKLKGLQTFAADTHFGVREIAWMAVRPSISKELLESLKILESWTSNKNEYIRRFACEATRPRGVWCEHIKALKQNPSLGLSIIEPLHSDPSKYVQDSVANWLNDASKSNPHFVIDLCNDWQKEGNTKETQYIIKRALRTVDKNSKKG
jgi:3-methyladenine DNA glycosylase AlkC